MAVVRVHLREPIGVPLGQSRNTLVTIVNHHFKEMGYAVELASEAMVIRCQSVSGFGTMCGKPSRHLGVHAGRASALTTRGWDETWR